MLQFDNLNDVGMDWLNEPQLIVPVVDGDKADGKRDEGASDAPGGADQPDQPTVLMTNGGGPAFVIGLDTSLFDNYGSKSDLLVMAPAEAPKSEMVWNGNSFEKPISKDILNVMQEPSKPWDELTKSGDMAAGEMAAGKVDGNFLTEPDMMNGEKKEGSDIGQQHYIVGYYPVVESCNGVVVTLQPNAAESTGTQGTDIVENYTIHSAQDISQFFVNSNGSEFRWMSGEESANVENVANVDTLPDTFLSDKPNNRDMPILEMNNTQDSLMKSLQGDSEDKLNEMSFVEEKSEGVGSMTKDDMMEVENSFILEQSLPLKKKSKMKRSSAGVSNNSQSEDEIKNALTNLLDSVLHDEPDTSITSTGNRDDANDSDYNESPLNHVERSQAESPTFTLRIKTSDSGILRKEEEKYKSLNGRPQTFSNMVDLLECLKTEKYISDNLMKVLLRGLSEMKVDVLREMYEKRDGGGYSTIGEGINAYSCHLKAFALITYFKQPTAFARLAEMFGHGWPSIKIIKTWKMHLNNYRRSISC